MALKFLLARWLQRCFIRRHTITQITIRREGAYNYTQRQDPDSALIMRSFKALYTPFAKLHNLDMLTAVRL